MECDKKSRFEVGGGIALLTLPIAVLGRTRPGIRRKEGGVSVKIQGWRHFLPNVRRKT